MKVKFSVFLDVDECEMTPCVGDALCVNTLGSFFCDCLKTGFEYSTSGCIGQLQATT